MNWLDELSRLVELYRKELGEEIARFLIAVPRMARLPIGKLARIGQEASWGEITSRFNGYSAPEVVSPEKALTQVYENVLGIVDAPSHLVLSYLRYTVRLSFGDSDLWRLAYAAVLAWREAHSPDFTEPVLPVDPVERLEVLCQVIEQTNDGANLDMTQVHTTLRELGVPERFDGFAVRGIYDGSGPDADIRADICLAHLATNPTASLRENNSLEFCSGNYHYRILEIPESFAKIGRSFIARRTRLYISSVGSLTKPE